MLHVMDFSQQQLAVWGILRQTDSEQQADAVIAAGAVPLLVELLRSDLPALQKAAAGALWFLALGSQQSKDAIISGGDVPPLAAL